MPIPKLILLIINILGGVAVIGSYIFGLAGKSADTLWGGTPSSIRPFYFISMLLAAIGYFFFIYFILFKMPADISNFKLLYLIFCGILIPSAFWMPLSNLFVSQSTASIWLAVRGVLILVGLFSCALVWFLFSLHGTGTAYWLAIAGSLYFAFHTTVLDMILWPILFRMS